jgi:hypothetical protein
MKKNVSILIVALFVSSVLFAQDSIILLELNEFKTFVHYCKIHDTEIVNISPIVIEDIVGNNNNKKIEKLGLELWNSVEDHFSAKYVVANHRAYTVVHLAYQTSNDDLYVIKIDYETKSLFLFKTTKNGFNKTEQNLFLLCTLEFDSNDRGTEIINSKDNYIESFVSDELLIGIITYMIEMNVRSEILPVYW